MKEYIVKADFIAEGDELVSPYIVSELIRCKDCKHRPHADKYSHIMPPIVQVGVYEGEPEYDDDMTCPYVCDDGWYSRVPADEQYCDRAERREE